MPTPTDVLHRHVIAVPPLARDDAMHLDREQNQRIIDHLIVGGVRTFLYGGNAMFYHLNLRQYADTLDWLSTVRDAGNTVVPSIGPTYGLLTDQADVLADHAFETAMVLPQRDIADPAGTRHAVETVAGRLNRPVVLYIKFDGYLDVADVRSLFDAGVIDWIKYAVVRDDPTDDDYLRELVDAVDPTRIISGIGEQPAIVHMRDFGLGGYTSGCVCVAPSSSQTMLEHCRGGEWDAADAIRRRYEPLEDLRNGIHPIRVLHEAVDAAGIATTGPVPPLLSPLGPADRRRVAAAARELRHGSIASEA